MTNFTMVDLAKIAELMKAYRTDSLSWAVRAAYRDGELSEQERTNYLRWVKTVGRTTMVNDTVYGLVPFEKALARENRSTGAFCVTNSAGKIAIIVASSPAEAISTSKYFHHHRTRAKCERLDLITAESPFVGKMLPRWISEHRVGIVRFFGGRARLEEPKE